MVRLSFQDDRILMIVLSGQVSSEDVDQAWAALGDSEFSNEHDVVVDMRQASIGFSAADIPAIIRHRDQLPSNAQGITCFIAQSHLAGAVINLVKGLVPRRTRWYVVSDIEAAMARIRRRRQR